MIYHIFSCLISGAWYRNSFTYMEKHRLPSFWNALALSLSAYLIDFFMACISMKRATPSA